MNIIINCLIAIFLTLCNTSVFSSDTFGGFQSKHEKLKGHYIYEVGNAKKVDPPYGKKWSKDLYQLNGRCFTINSYAYQGMWGYSGKAAFIVANERNDTKLALIEKSISNIEVKLDPITLIKCPQEAGVMPTCDTQEECAALLEALKKRMIQQRKETEELLKKLKDN